MYGKWPFINLVSFIKNFNPHQFWNLVKQCISGVTTTHTKWDNQCSGLVAKPIAPSLLQFHISVGNRERWFVCKIHKFVTHPQRTHPYGRLKS